MVTFRAIIEVEGEGQISRIISARNIDKAWEFAGKFGRVVHIETVFQLGEVGCE